MKIEEMIRETQAAIGVHVDGRAGPDTWSAIHTALVRPGERERGDDDEGVQDVDPRSERVIATLLPEVRPFARKLVQRARDAGITIKVISGLRTFAEQDALFAQGRSLPGHIVTNARGGYSNHNFGIAFDVGVFEGSRYLGDSPKYKTVGVLGQQLGLDWGGNWKTIVDLPHFQLRPAWAKSLSEGDMLAALRARHSEGRGIYS